MRFPTAIRDTDQRLIGFDIETDTSSGGLDPESSSVVAAALWNPAASAPGERAEVFVGDETDILRGIDERIGSLGPAVLVTWNGARFDLPFVAHRARRLGLELGLCTTQDQATAGVGGRDQPPLRARWHSMVHLDGYRLYRADVGRTLGLSCGLKSLARLTGTPAIELDRSRLHRCSEAEIREYVASDARVAVELVARRMPVALRAADWGAPCRNRELAPTTPMVGRSTPRPRETDPMPTMSASGGSGS
ncbi:MAG: 3'-5' exonuclease [Microthrixaceae bacterium]